MLKDTIDSKNSKLDFPLCFVENDYKIYGSKSIEDKCNKYFMKIGPERLGSTDTSYKIFYNCLKSPCQLSFQLQYTTPW